MNHLDAKPIARMAERLAAIIPQTQARVRFANLAQRAMFEDERCSIEANADDIAAAPAWAAEAAREGRKLYIFHPHPTAITGLRRAARALRDACLESAELGALAAPSPRDVMMRELARELLDKAERMPLATLSEKALYIAAERRRRLSAAKAEEVLFAPQEIFVAPGRVWRRVLSTAEMGRVGMEMRNCLAMRSTRHRSYAKQLTEDSARFYVLRDETGAALAAVMVAVAAAQVIEARRTRNASLDIDDPNFRALVRALSVDFAPAFYAAARQRRQEQAREEVVLLTLRDIMLNRNGLGDDDAEDGAPESVQS